VKYFPALEIKAKCQRCCLFEDSNFDSFELNAVASISPNKVAHYIGKKL
jgi:hypothetical protein